jgi:uncharacterized membrane protein
MEDKNKTENKVSPLPAPINKEFEQLVPEEDKRGKILSIFSKRFIGPLPPPEDLEKYNEVVPGLAERIVKLTENQSSHRIEIEKLAISSQLSESKRGQYMGFILALVCIGSSVFLALNNQHIVASVLGGSTVIGLVTIFFAGKKEQKRDLEQKS